MVRGLNAWRRIVMSAVDCRRGGCSCTRLWSRAWITPNMSSGRSGGRGGSSAPAADVAVRAPRPTTSGCTAPTRAHFTFLPGRRQGVGPKYSLAHIPLPVRKPRGSGPGSTVRALWLPAGRSQAIGSGSEVGVTPVGQGNRGKGILGRMNRGLACGRGVEKPPPVWSRRPRRLAPERQESETRPPVGRQANAGQRNGGQGNGWQANGWQASERWS